MADHLKELKKIKKISTLSFISIKDITWFLKTAIFVLLDEMREAFSIKHIALYECMLKKVRIFPKRAIFLKHKQLLLDLKNEKLLYLLKKKNEKESKWYVLLEDESEMKRQVPVRLFPSLWMQKQDPLRDLVQKLNKLN